jgi:hydrogenase maturation protease
MSKVLVACVGNIFQGDDAFGCEVAKVLIRRPPDGSVRVIDFGIRGLDLTYALLDAPPLTILVDTVARGGEPGTIYTLEPDLNHDEFAAASHQQLDPHALDPLQMLRAAKAMGGRLQRILVVGCEPADLGGEHGRMGLTAPVMAAVPLAADMVESLIGKELQV